MTRVRMDLLARPDAPRALAASMYSFAVAVMAAAILIMALGWSGLG